MRIALSRTTRSLRPFAVARSSARCLSTAADPDAPLPLGKPVVLDYAALARADTSQEVVDAIKEAYGADGLGLLVVKNVPKFPEKRQELLPLGYRLAQLPDSVMAKYEHSSHNVGWVKGKETFKGEVDVLKSYFTANPQYDQPSRDPAMIEKYPEYLAPNMWPAEMPNLAPAFKGLGTTMVNVGLEILKHCDEYVASELPGYKRGTLYRIVKESVTCKARLLHYYPLTKNTVGKEWCGYHNDHGLLTALTSARFHGPDGLWAEAPDKRSGLAAAPRGSDSSVKVQIPWNCVAYQIGECAQILTGGLLRATPHMVRGPGKASVDSGISRTTFAVFMQPNVHEPLDLPNDPSVNEAEALHTTPLVPELAKRWKRGYDFATFTKATIPAYLERDGYD